MERIRESSRESSRETRDVISLTEADVAGLVSIIEQAEQTGYLATKVQSKIDAKQCLTQDDGNDEWETWKRLGMFLVHDQKFTPKFAAILRQHGVDILDDESVLELHVPPQRAEKVDRVRSIVRLVEYLKANATERSLPRFIYGVSYFASKAAEFGFEVVDLPEQLRRSTGAAGLLQLYANSTDPKLRAVSEHFSIHDIKLCYIATDDLIRFAESLENYESIKLQIPAWLGVKRVGAL